MSVISFSKMFKIIQNCSDVSHASSGAGNGGKCSESFFLVFLKEQGTRNWETGSKRTGNEGKEEFLKGKCNQGKQTAFKFSSLL